jgi:hypothetical protein
MRVAEKLDWKWLRLKENILISGQHKFSQYDYIILLSAHTHIAITMISLQAGICSSALCNTIIGSLVRRNCTLLHTLKANSHIP